MIQFDGTIVPSFSLPPSLRSSIKIEHRYILDFFFGFLHKEIIQRLPECGLMRALNCNFVPIGTA